MNMHIRRHLKKLSEKILLKPRALKGFKRLAEISCLGRKEGRRGEGTLLIVDRDDLTGS